MRMNTEEKLAVGYLKFYLFLGKKLYLACIADKETKTFLEMAVVSLV